MAKEYTQDQLQHYLEHPEEIDATDTDLIEALARAELPAGLRESEAGETEEGGDADAEAKAAAKAKADEEAKAKAEADAKAKADAEAAKGESGKETEGTRVLTKDGKNTIPFKVLDEAREGKAAAEQALAEAQATIISLADRVKALTDGKTDPGAAEGERTVEDLRKLAEEAGEEAPWAKTVLEKLVEKIEAAHEELAELRGEREETEAQARERLQAAADQALNANPTLILWQTEAPELFEEAVAFDEMIRKNPRMARRFPTFENRYDHVVGLVKTAHAGEEIPLPEPIADPAASASPAAKPAAAKPAADASSSDAKARAEKALREAADRTSVTTLSDIPGGAGEVSDQESLSRMDVTDIAAKFAKMGTQDIINWVSTH